MSKLVENWLIVSYCAVFTTYQKIPDKLNLVINFWHWMFSVFITNSPLKRYWNSNDAETSEFELGARTQESRDKMIENQRIRTLTRNLRWTKKFILTSKFVLTKCFIYFVFHYILLLFILCRHAGIFFLFTDHWDLLFFPHLMHT